MFSERRDTVAARRFFNRAVSTNGSPDRIAIEKSGANLVGLQSLNVILKLTGVGQMIAIVQSQYLNNIVEQGHRFIKRITRPMLGCNAVQSAAATLARVEAVPQPSENFATKPPVMAILYKQIGNPWLGASGRPHRHRSRAWSP